jgi:hypothetical protein
MNSVIKRDYAKIKIDKGMDTSEKKLQSLVATGGLVKRSLGIREAVKLPNIIPPKSGSASVKALSKSRSSTLRLKRRKEARETVIALAERANIAKDLAALKLALKRAELQVLDLKESNRKLTEEVGMLETALETMGKRESVASEPAPPFTIERQPSGSGVGKQPARTSSDPRVKRGVRVNRPSPVGDGGMSDDFFAAEMAKHFPGRKFG